MPIAEQTQNGQLTVQIETVENPTTAPTPTLMFDLRSLFDLEPGEYTLSVEVTGFLQYFESFDFVVRDSYFEVVSALTGSWFDPEEPGHGLNIEVFEGNRIIAYWYAYNDEGENVWLIANGTFLGAVAELDVQSASGRFFPPDYDPESHELEPWGALRFEFNGCTTATLSWEPIQDGFSPGQTELIALSPANGLSCFDDDLQSDGLFVDNLFGEDSEGLFAVFNGTSVDTPGAENWSAEFAELPDSLGSGSALFITPNAVDFELWLARELPGISSLPLTSGNSHPGDYAIQLELQIALPRAQLCLPGGELHSVRAYLSRREPVVLDEIIFGSRVSIPVSRVADIALAHVEQLTDEAFCESGPDYVVRTFRSSGRDTVNVTMDELSLGFSMFSLDALEDSPEGMFVLSVSSRIRPVFMP